jgi:hypothetical protein
MADALEEVIYRHGTYAPLVGNVFDVRDADGGSVPVELVNATELPGRGECFSLVFRAQAGVPLDQRTYRVEHGTLGGFLLFLVPIGQADDGRQELEAVVNRLQG